MRRHCQPTSMYMYVGLILYAGSPLGDKLCTEESPTAPPTATDRNLNLYLQMRFGPDFLFWLGLLYFDGHLDFAKVLLDSISQKKKNRARGGIA